MTEEEWDGGIQKLYRFIGNNYGASVIRTLHSYGREEGLWELAVIKWDDKNDFHLCYDTPITDDVLGYLTEEEVEESEENAYARKLEEADKLFKDIFSNPFKSIGL